MKFLLLEHYVDNRSTYFIHYSHSLEFWKERKNNHDPPSVTNRNAPRPFIQSSPLSPTSTSERWRKRKESFDRAWKQSKEKLDGTEREREPTFISTGNTESAASSSSSTTAIAASGRHSGDVVNEQSFEPNMLSPRSVEPIFNLSRCGARASASRFPVCQTGKPGQTFELAQTVWHPTTYRLRGPRILNMLLYHRHRFICGCLSSPTSNVCLSLCPRNFLPPRPPSPLFGRLKVQRWCTSTLRLDSGRRCLLSLGGNRWFWPRICLSSSSPTTTVASSYYNRQRMEFVLIWFDLEMEGMEIWKIFLDDCIYIWKEECIK